MTDGSERADAGRPGAVRAVVRRVRRHLAALRAAEGVLFFGAAALVVWSAGLAAGLAGSEPLPLALLCGALASVTWWCEHASDLAATAAALDERLGFRGALVTAFELEERATRRTLLPLEELVRARVLARLSFGESLRSLLPSPLVPLAAPVAAGLVLAFVLEARPASAPRAPDLARPVAGLREALAVDPGVPEAPEGAPVAHAEQELAELRALAGALVERMERVERTSAAPEESAEAREEARALDRRLAALEAETAPASPLRERLARARAWLDALRAGLAAQSGASTGETGGAPDGTISRPFASPNGTEPAPGSLATVPPASATTFAAPPGVQAGSFWPAEYDAVVERWIELSRAARADEGK